MVKAKWRFVHQKSHFGGWRGRSGGSSTKRAVLVDGEGEVAVRPPKEPFWWMAKAGSGAGRHEATCHPRLGGACEATASQRQGRRGSPVPPGLAESKGQAGGITGVFSPGGKTYTACTGKRDPARRACGPPRVRGKTPENCARNDNCPSRNCPRRRRAGGCWRCA